MTKYFRIFTWLALDALSLYHRRIMIVAILIGIALLCQVGAIGLIFGYAKAVQAGSIFYFNGMTINVRESFAILFVIASSSFIMLFVYALFSFFQQRQILYLAQAYRKDCLKRFISICSYLPHPTSEIANSMIGNTIVPALGDKEANACAKTLEQLLKISPKAIAIPIFLLVLLFIDYKLTLILLFLSVFTLYPLYLVNMRIAHLGDVTKLNRKNAMIERSEIKTKLKSRVNTIKNEDIDEELSFLRHTDQHDLNNFFASISNEMTINFFTAFSFATVIIYEGDKLLLGEFPWEQMIIFLTVLRFMLASIKACVLGLSKISRHYVKLKIYYVFIMDTLGFDTHEKNVWNLQSLQPSDSVSGSENYSANDFHKNTLALFSTNLADKKLLFLFSKALSYNLESNPTNRVHPELSDIWTSFKGTVALTRLRDLLNIPDEIEQDFFQKRVQDICAKVQPNTIGVLEEISTINLNSTMSFSTFNQFSDTIQNVLLLASSTLSDRKLVILLYAAGLEVLLDKFKRQYKLDKTYFILYKNYQDIKEDTCFLLNDFEDIKVLRVEDLRREPNNFLVKEGENNSFDTFPETSEE